MITYEARDGERTFVFTGRILGEASSQESGKKRWTESRVYRTDGGKYVVEIIGRSIIPGEHDRCRTQVCESARGAVESLYIIDDDQVRYIPRVNRKAAVIAATADDEFSQAFYIEEVA